jgi:hypothetical protein
MKTIKENQWLLDTYGVRQKTDHGVTVLRLGDKAYISSDTVLPANDHGYNRDAVWGHADCRAQDYADAIHAKAMRLKKFGFIIGKRDPRANTDFPGAFMVIEAHGQGELPTQDGRNGPWCIVDDNLSALILSAYEGWQGIIEGLDATAPGEDIYEGSPYE